MLLTKCAKRKNDRPWSHRTFINTYMYSLHPSCKIFFQRRDSSFLLIRNGKGASLLVHCSSLFKYSLNKSFSDIKKVRNYHGKPAIFHGCILPLWVLYRYYKKSKSLLKPCGKSVVQGTSTEIIYKEIWIP